MESPECQHQIDWNQEIEQRVVELVTAELNKFMKTLDKRIEKAVIEKMNEYIRRAKKK